MLKYVTHALSSLVIHKSKLHLCHLYYVVIKNIVNGDLDSKYLQALAANGGPFSLQAPNWHQLSNAEETVGTIFFDNRFLPTGDKNYRSH